MSNDTVVIGEEESRINSLMDLGKFTETSEDDKRLIWHPPVELFDLLIKLLERKENEFIPVDTERKVLLTGRIDFDDSFYYIKRVLTYLFQKSKSSDYYHEKLQKENDELKSFIEGV